MKTATIERLKKDLDTVLDWVARGEWVQIRKGGRVLAVLTPAASQTAPVARADKGNGQRPDFLARLKRIYGDNPLPVTGAEIVAQDRDRY